MGQCTFAADLFQPLQMGLLATLLPGLQSQAGEGERSFAGRLAQLCQVADGVVDGFTLALGSEQSAGQFVQDVLLHGLRRIAQTDPGQTEFVLRQRRGECERGLRVLFARTRVRLFWVPCCCSSCFFIYITTTTTTFRLQILKWVGLQILKWGDIRCRLQILKLAGGEAEEAARLALQGSDGLQAPLHRTEVRGATVAFLEILLDGAQYGGCDLPYLGMGVVLCLLQKLDVIPVEIEGVGQRQRLIVKGVDVATETALGVTYPAAKREPAGGTQDRHGPGDGGLGADVGGSCDLLVGGEGGRVGAGGDLDHTPDAGVHRLEHRVLEDQPRHGVVPVAEEQQAVGWSGAAGLGGQEPFHGRLDEGIQGMCFGSDLSGIALHSVPHRLIVRWS